MKDLEEMARALEASPDYRVLRRLKLEAAATYTPEEKLFSGIYLDVESTGLDIEKDEVIELGMLPFAFTRDGRIASFGQAFHSYQEPSLPISAEITKITGLTHEKVAGHKIDPNKVELLVLASQIVIAHNAAFDRPMAERLSPAFTQVAWGCSMSQPPWGGAGRKLEYLLASMGLFFEPHNVVADCEAGLFALMASPEGPKTALSYILDATRVPSWHVWALNAPYDLKDALKARRYFWNDGSDSRPKAWHKEIAGNEDGNEAAWLETHIYKGRPFAARFDKVTARERFTKRS